MAHEHTSHCNNMCAMTCCPGNIKLDELKTIVSKPEYICKSCGHVANEQSRLCEPVPLS